MKLFTAGKEVRNSVEGEADLTLAVKTQNGKLGCELARVGPNTVFSPALRRKRWQIICKNADHGQVQPGCCGKHMVQAGRKLVAPEVD